MQLTDQQQAIVEHLRGPALVFAVAGSGKTTCMVHRIRHLIEQQVARPQQILATSFNTAAVRDMVAQLQRIGVPEGVDCRTLHSLGYHIIRQAVQQGLLEAGWLKQQDNSSDGLLQQTLIQLSRSSGMDSAELGIDREDLANQISIWKGNLEYADLAGSGLPQEAQKTAGQAKHDNPLYLQAYQVYEKLRRERQVITFDDMLMTAWELLMQHEELLLTLQNSYTTLIVDEFQDVNLAQYLILDLLSATHRNYMAIGDDDQCIYEWRGAEPRFILGFEEAYQARVFTISDNFRCPAPQVVLANEVIHQNIRRYAKRLSLTRGFEGEVRLIGLKDEWAVARHIADEIGRLLKEGVKPSEMVVLIRLYSETAYLETALMDAGQSYFVEGGQPFYRREELVTLFRYLSFAQLDAQISRHGFPSEDRQAAKYLEMFEAIINRPRRFIARNFSSYVCQQARRKGCSVLDLAEQEVEQLKKRSADNLLAFIRIIRGLSGKLKQPAGKVLKWLVNAIEYRSYLLEVSGRREQGITRVQTVDALIEFARTRGSCLDLLGEVRRLSSRAAATAGEQGIRMMTIYRSKGLEWDVVFIPGCRDGLLPCVSAEDARSGDGEALLEAERRLFYVALTRSRQTSYLYHPANQPASPFLEKSDAATLLNGLQHFRDTLCKGKLVTRETDAINLIYGIGRFHLARFFATWQPMHPAMKTNIRLLIKTIRRKLEQAEKQHGDYQQKMEAYRQALKQFQDRRASFGDELLQMNLFIRKYKNAFQVLECGDELQFDTDSDGDIIVVAGRSLAGFLDLKDSAISDPQVLQWERCRGEIVAVQDSTGWIEAKFTRIALNGAGKSAAAPEEPARPPGEMGLLATGYFQDGLAAMEEILRS